MQAAYKETAAERTAKTSFEVTTSPPVEAGDEGGPAPMVLTLRGEGVTNSSGTEFATTMNMLGMNGFEVRHSDDVVYMRPPEDFRHPEFPDAKPRIRVSANEAYKESDPSLMGAEETQDPARQLEYLLGVSNSIEKAGEEVRGVRTTHYKVVVDLNKEAAGQDTRTRKECDQMIGQLGTSKVPFEVWIDGQNLARRVATGMIVPGPEGSAAPNAPGGDEARLRMVTEYYDFGTPLDVQAPPPEQTAHGPRLLAAERPAAR